MAKRSNAETMLISAALNLSDPMAPKAMGIQPEMFAGYQAEYRWMITFQMLYGKIPEPETILNKFPSFPLTDTRDLAYAVDEVLQDHKRASFVTAMREATERISEGDIDAAISSVVTFMPPTFVTPLTNVLGDYSILDNYDIPLDTNPVPYKSLQGVTGGQRRGDLWYVAARLGNGKSWTLCDMAAESLMSGKRVVMYSLEMSEEQMKLRMQVMLGQRLGIEVDHVAMRDRKFDRIAYRKLLEQIKERVAGELYIHDSSRSKVSPLTIAAQGKDFDVSYVDYVGLMHTGTGGRSIDDWRAAASISNQLKEVALTCDTRIVAAAQINREGVSSGWQPPDTNTLAQSDALGQDADVVLTQKQYGKAAMAYRVCKNRHGASGQYFFTQFFPNGGKFAEISRDEADLLKEEHEDDE